MGTQLKTAVAFESAFPHETELVLNALFEAGISAAKVGQSNGGQVHFLASTELTPEAFWSVVVPADQLAAALAIVAMLPVTRPEEPLMVTSQAEVRQGSRWLVFGTAAALLAALYVHAC